MSTTLISGGTVVTASGTLDADVLIAGEKIAAVLARDLTGEPGAPPADAPAAEAADQVIDATGKYVMPGGIDAHTHMEMPFGGTFSADTFETGTRAAAWGGTTTIIDFAVQAKGTSLLATLDKWHAKADGNCAVDYGFHMIVSDVNDQTLKEMDACIEAGVNSFKMFMAYPGVFYATDGEILLAMQQASRSGATVMMHAENGIAIDQLVAQAIASGRTDPVEHGLTRPPELEGEATSRAITLAKVAGCPLYIVHLSARQALEAVAAGAGHRAERVRRDLPAVPVAVHRRPGPAGLRGGQVRGLAAAADRGPPGLAVEGPADQRPVGGVHGPLPVLLQGPEGTRPGRLLQDPQRDAGGRAPDGPAAPGRGRRGDHADPLGGDRSTTPARMFGLYPRKGVIAAGSDADIVIYDPPARQTLSAATHHMNVDYSAYEGMEITGQVVPTLSRGQVVVGDGGYQGSPGRGAFLHRGLNQYLV